MWSVASPAWKKELMSKLLICALWYASNSNLSVTFDWIYWDNNISADTLKSKPFNLFTTMAYPLLRIAGVNTYHYEYCSSSWLKPSLSFYKILFSYCVYNFKGNLAKALYILKLRFYCCKWTSVIYITMPWKSYDQISRMVSPWF